MLLDHLTVIGTAGVPAGLSVALAIASERMRSSRRRAAINRSLHELRRPLQALSLATSARGGSAASSRSAVVTRRTVEAALAALTEVDRRVNGLAPLPSPQPLTVSELVRDATERWLPTAAVRGRPLSVRCDAPAATVVADLPRVERAIDNLIANALEHGTGRVRIFAALAPAAVRIAVADDGAAKPESDDPRLRGRPGALQRLRRGLSRRDPRRGHGLRIVDEAARDHGGRFLLERSRDRTEAILELPLAAAPEAVQGAPAA